MKNYSSLKKAALLSVSMLVGMSAANAHTTNLDASVLGNCDALTSFARNANHNDAQMSKEQRKVMSTPEWLVRFNIKINICSLKSIL